MPEELRRELAGLGSSQPYASGCDISSEEDFILN
jgi:hypothetical protein